MVSIEKKYQDEQGSLNIDTTFRPEEYATLKGVVVSVPDRVDEQYYTGKIDQLVRIGDEVWFSYSVIYDYKVYREGETPVYKNLISYNGEQYWKVNYEEVFCVVRGGEILMPTQHVLLAPIKDERVSSGLISVTQKMVYDDRATVVAMPSTSISCKVGDVVPLEKEFVQKYMIFDKPHYIISTRRLIAKF